MRTCPPSPARPGRISASANRSTGLDIAEPVQQLAASTAAILSVCDLPWLFLSVQNLSFFEWCFHSSELLRRLSICTFSIWAECLSYLRITSSVQSHCSTRSRLHGFRYSARFLRLYFEVNQKRVFWPLTLWRKALKFRRDYVVISSRHQ